MFFCDSEFHAYALVHRVYQYIYNQFIQTIPINEEEHKYLCCKFDILDSSCELFSFILAIFVSSSAVLNFKMKNQIKIEDFQNTIKLQYLIENNLSLQSQQQQHSLHWL